MLNYYFKKYFLFRSTWDNLIGYVGTTYMSRHQFNRKFDKTSRWDQIDMWGVLCNIKDQ